MTTTKTQQIDGTTAVGASSESQRREQKTTAFNFEKNFKLIHAVKEKNCPDFDDVRAYAGLEQKILDKQTELGRTPADKRVLRKLIDEQNAFGEKIQLAFDHLLNSVDLSKYTKDVIADIGEVDQSLAQRLADRQDLYHHKKYISQIKDKHPAKVMPQSISQPLIPKIKPEERNRISVAKVVKPEGREKFSSDVSLPSIQLVPSAESEVQTVDIGDHTISPVASDDKIIDEQLDTINSMPEDQAIAAVPEVPKQVAAEVGETVSEENLTVDEKVNRWFDLAGKGRKEFTTAEVNQLKRPN